MKPIALMMAGATLAIAAPAMAQVMTPTEYVKTAGASDLYERQSSQMVLESTQDPKLRAFAQEMIADHMKSTAMVKAASLVSRVKAGKPMLTPTQDELIAELRTAAGPARDKLYVAQQKAAHNQALAVQQAYATDGTAPALKTAAGKIVPVVEHHVAMLKTM